jgi:hypothetical protein
MTITYHNEVYQGSAEWLALRCGLLTASEMKLIITAKKLEYAQNEKEKAHLYELAAQRINNYVEPTYIGDDMLRGSDDESYARGTYDENYEPVTTCGFITNDKWGFTLGYSPDGLCGDVGAIEAKSRKQKFQMEVIMTGLIPDEHVIQVQTGLLVSEREWLDYISYCGGMPMKVIRALPDEKVQAAIIKAATIFHEKLDKIIVEYGEKIVGLIPTERVDREISV